MAEYIKREDAQNMLEKAQIITDAEGEFFGYCTEDVNINAIPAADVRENVRGEWLLTLSDVYDFYKCSVCGHRIEAPGGVSHENFCPNCGAYMRGENNGQG